MLKNEEKRSKPIMAQIARALSSLPRHACRSVPFDRGSEFIDGPHLQSELGTQTWLYEAQSPWQNGAVDNAISGCALALPRHRYDLRTLCARLNATPRKCLGFRTPAEVFRSNTCQSARKTAPLSASNIAPLDAVCAGA